ncbi:MAG: tRNA (adenosine(37)-N6)-threonylcarbamoyltransferase complex ATPase subunit type 1 TsaE [Candidatus Omnitrophica bacterium]|nr:tRNA (adenosine(37)-N6)-threonylcarbamoyltransferase complex ATPase subunit type 1 TsaE [Candidatus Omnitrophota bacterium]MDD5487636.1 tRNA (adenosine(37)-N6)-threonylcarbamoyltransferase complex ATPase subunit type 1 TsaE [Candidatus Omnitrophota bacterium]
MYTRQTQTPEDTIELGSRIGSVLEKGDFIALTGELGAGKTMFVKGLAKGLGVDGYVYVNSPTFVIMKEYYGRTALYHFDVYRLEEDALVDTLDYESYFYGDGITVVEWADKIPGLLPEDRLEILIEHAGTEGRRFTFKVSGKFPARRIEEICGK